MSISAKTLLSKGAWTGREVGTALLMTLKYAKEKAEEGSKKPAPFTNADISRMANSLKDSAQIGTYLEYLSIYEALVDSHNVNEGMIQQYYHGYYRYLMAIQETYRGENIKAVINKFPVIMTQKEHDAELKRLTKKQESIAESFAFAIVSACHVYAERYEDGETVPAPIKKALDKLKKEPVTDNIMIEAVREEETYYKFILPTGGDTDSMNEKEWSAALDEACGGRQNRINLYHEALFEEDEGLRRIYKKNTGKDLPDDKIEAAREAFSYLVFAAKAKIFPSVGGSFGGAALVCALMPEPVKVRFEKVEPEPKQISKYDVLLLEELTNYFGSDDMEEGGGEQDFERFMDEYPALYKAVRAELEKAYPKAKKIKAGGYCDWSFATWGDFAKAGFLNYKDLASYSSLREAMSYPSETPTERDRRRSDRACLNGIAIYQGGEDYKDPFEDAKIYAGVDYLIHNAEAVKTMQDTIETLALPALRFVCGFNEFLLALSEVYELPFLKALSVDLSKQEKQIEEVNSILYSLYAEVSGTEEEKAEKRRFVKEHFAPIRAEDIKPSEKGKARIREALKAIRGTDQARSFFKYFERAIVMTMREGGEEKWLKDLEKIMD